MQTLPYQQAFDRIRSEYLEMPGMRLTAEQVKRLCGVDALTCEHVLDDLARAKFLQRHADGSYARITGTTTRAPLRMAAAISRNPIERMSKRAS